MHRAETHIHYTTKRTDVFEMYSLFFFIAETHIHYTTKCIDVRMYIFIYAQSGSTHTLRDLEAAMAEGACDVCF